MIVEPDFLTHWKTQALTAALDDKCAPLYVIALWAHSHQRKTDRFAGMTCKVFASICRYAGDPEFFFQAMLDCGWIEVGEGSFVVHGFAETNAKLFANWTNGSRGGRGITHAEPNPELGEPIDKIDRVDRKKKARTVSRPPLPDEDWLKDLGKQDCYAHCRVSDEHGKMLLWCQQKKKTPTRQRFLAWLNRIERPMNGAGPPRSTAPKRELPERFRSFLLERYPDRREQISTWRTWDQLPSALHGDYEAFKKEKAT